MEKIKMKLKMLVKGTVKRTGKDFEQEVTFELVPPDDNTHYGNGYYMTVDYGNEYGPALLDIRYERLDIETLAKRWCNAFYGENLCEATIIA